MDYDILNYKILYNENTNCSESTMENKDIINDYITITKQASKVFHYQNDQFMEEINYNADYKTYLFNILISDTPFQNFLRYFKADFSKSLQLYAEIDSTFKGLSGPNQIIKEGKSIEKCQNKIIDGSISKIIKFLLTTVKYNLRSMNNETFISYDVFKTIEESIQELPVLILSKSINDSHGSSILEIKNFIHDIFEDKINDLSCQYSLEIWLLLFTRIGTIDLILEWFGMVVHRLAEGEELMIRTEILNTVLESFFVTDSNLTTEVKDHLKDCIDIDFLDQETVDLRQATNYLFLGILRALKIHSKNDQQCSEPDGLQKQSNEYYKDIYIWEHGCSLQSIKAPYPDSLQTRLNWSHDRISIQQVICSQSDLIVVNNFGNVRTRNLLIKNEGEKEDFKLFFNKTWSPIKFPDENCKIKHISVGWISDNAKQHFMALTQFGQVFSWGDGSYGKLGHGDLKDRNYPTLIKNLSGYKIKSISCGGNHSSAVSETGLGFVWGNAINFNGKESEICLLPKRLQQGIMSDIICGISSTFIIGINKRTIYYLGSNYFSNKLFTEDFILPSYPNLLEGLPLIKCRRKEMILKTVVNSNGILVLLNNGDLYSIGYGLILGCPNCQVHRKFERVKSMVNVNVLDVAVSTNHVIVLSHNVIYSWSLTASVLILVQESLMYSLTSISGIWLTDINKQINIAWSKYDKGFTQASTRVNKNDNPFLCIKSVSSSVDQFNHILKSSLEFVHKSEDNEKIIINTLKLLLKYLKSDQFSSVSSEFGNLKMGIHNLIKTVIFIGDADEEKKFIKVVCSIIDEMCLTCYQNSEDKADYLCEILNNIVITSNTKLSFCHWYMLKALINSFNDESKEMQFIKLLQLPFLKLDSLLISVCRFLSSHVIGFLQSKMFSYRSEGLDGSINDLCILLHQFSTIGYRIFFLKLGQQFGSTNNPISNLCSLLPLTNSVIDYFKSFLKHIIKSQKVNQWMKTDGVEINVLLSKTPIGWILFDVFNYLMDHNKLDILPITPHLEHLIFSLDSINKLLPKTAISDTQEMQWPLYGFPGCPNISKIISEPGMSWLWLLDLQRLTGLVLGKNFKKELINFNSMTNEENKISNWLETPLFKHLNSLPLSEINETHDIEMFSSSYREMLKLLSNRNSDMYFVWSEPNLLYSAGLHIFTTIIYILNQTYNNVDVQFLSNSVTIYGSAWKIMKDITKHLSSITDFALFPLDRNMTTFLNERSQNYISVVKLKCCFLINIMKTSIKSTFDDIHETQSLLINALDLALENPKPNERKNSGSSDTMIEHSHRYSNLKDIEWPNPLKDIGSSLHQFLVTENLLGESTENDLIESTKTNIKNISILMLINRKSVDRISKVFKSFYQLLDSSKLSTDSVLIQVLNSITVPMQYSVEQMNNSHYKILQDILSILLKRLNKFGLQESQSVISQRFCLSIINFLSTNIYGHADLLTILIDGNFLHFLICYLNDRQFISCEKWLVIEGNGDSNLPKVSNMIVWCALENFILNLCNCENRISHERMSVIECQLRQLILKIHSEMSHGIYNRLFDLHYILHLIDCLCTKSTTFKSCCKMDNWIPVLSDIALNLNYLSEKNIFYCKYALNLTAINLLLSMMDFQTNQMRIVKNDQTIQSDISPMKIILRFSDFFNLLITKSVNLDITRHVNSLNLRINFYKDISENLEAYENLINYKWITGNCNFDKQHSLKCNFLAGDKVGLIKSSDGFLALSCEDIVHGIWKVTFEVICEENQVDFIYGFISTSTQRWPINHAELLKLLKQNSSVSKSCRSIVSHQLSCIIDVDQRFVYFSNSNDNIQTFTCDGDIYRFFISSVTNPNAFQIQMISIKQLCDSELTNDIDFYNNELLSPDHYVLFHAIHVGFNRLFKKNPTVILENIIKPIVEQSECLKRFDLFYDKNISTSSVSNTLMFGLFLLNDRITDTSFYRGKMFCMKNEHGLLHTGIILNFKVISNQTPIKGLNCLDKLTKTEDIYCCVYSETLKKDIQLPFNWIVKTSNDEISQFLSMIDQKIINIEDTIALLVSLFNCISHDYFDVELLDYEKIEWSNQASDCVKIDYNFLKNCCSRLMMQILSRKSIINTYIESDNDKNVKDLEKVYHFVITLGSKPSPLRRKTDVSDFQMATYQLMESFYQIFHENESELIKKYVSLYLEKNNIVDLRSNLSTVDRKILLGSLKRQSFGQDLINRITKKTKDDLLLSGSRPITFSDRRRQVFDFVQSSEFQASQNLQPDNEYDFDASYTGEGLQELESVWPVEIVNEAPPLDADQRLMDEFVLRTVNKSKKSYNCPICGVSLKIHIQSMFFHLSSKHPLNCKKTFQHHATCCIKSDGTVYKFMNSTFYCASITLFGYYVCEDYYNTKVLMKSFPHPCENLNSFIDDGGYIRNNLIGMSGTLVSVHYCYPNLSESLVSDEIRPKLNQVQILGDHIHQEINYSQNDINIFNSNLEVIDDSLLEETHFVSRLNSSAITKALHRIEYGYLVINSRKLIVKLTKFIFQRFSYTNALLVSKRLFFNDCLFVGNILRFFEGGRIKLNKQVNKVSNFVQSVNFSPSDFLSVVVLGLESSFTSHDNIHKFMTNYIKNLENFLTSNNDFFDLDDKFDASLLARPSILMVQLLFNTVIKVLSSVFIPKESYPHWQNEFEQITELLAYGTINKTFAKVKIWCLHNLMKIFRLIQKNDLSKIETHVNMVDLCEDLSLDDSPAIHMVNCNVAVKKMIYIANRRGVLTADCEGTMRLWDIDFIIGNEQNSKQTYLFSLGQEMLNGTLSKSSEIIDKCLQMTEPLRVDLSNYLVQVGVQKIAASPNGIFLAESIGVYLNIWSTRSMYSKPHVIVFPCLITALIFPRQTFGGLHGCLVDLLLVGLADGQLHLLRIFDNGTRITQQQIEGMISSNITTVSWEEERNLIAIGYHDGSIILTDQNGLQVVLETIHNNRILNLLYCPYSTQFEQGLLTSSSANESKIAVWNTSRLLCVFSLSASITCLEWLPKSFSCDDINHVIIAGLSTGLIQFCQLNGSGDFIRILMTFSGHLCEVLELKVCENTQILASGCSNGWVNVWSIKDRLLISTCCGDGSTIGIEWTSQNNLIAAFSRSQYIKIWRYFNNKTLEKSGIKPWAYVRKIFLEYTKTKSVKHLKNLKRLSLSLHKLLNEQFLEEVESIKSGFSIVYSQYLQSLIQYTISLKFVPKLHPSFITEPLGIENQCISLPVNKNNIAGRRGLLTHYLNLSDNKQSNHQLDWLFGIDETEKMTKFICFENEVSINLIPSWWWTWCIGSDEHVVSYMQAKWQNIYWSMDKQIELHHWYQNSPDFWIREYSDSTYIWGNGNKGELGFYTISEWTKPAKINVDGIQQMVCGAGVTLFIDCQGKLSACGEGLEIIFNPFMKEEAYRIINVPVLNDYKITHVTASCGPESHIIAITSFGEVFSWGIGSHGKLGHGHSTTLKKPKLIEALRGKCAVMADCGHDHSAVVTSSGELYTFGLGSNGQLGIETVSGSDTPRLVTFSDANFQTGLVACGMNHTIALSTDGLKAFSFGSGLYGKLGLNDFKDYFSPESLNIKKFKSLIKVVCGRSFSVALTSNGDVLTWGHEDYLGIGVPDLGADETSKNHISYPNVNDILSSIGAVSNIAAGNDTIFVLTTAGNLYGWGSNEHNILRLGSRPHAYTPEQILVHKNISLKQVSCGRNHVSVSSHSPFSYRNTIPTGPHLNCCDLSKISQMKYPALYNSELNIYDMTSRLIFLLYWHEMVRLTWQFWIPQTNQHYDLSNYDLDMHKYSLTTLNSWPVMNSNQKIFPQSNWNWSPFNNFFRNEVRQLLNNELVSCAMYRYMNGSVTNNRTYNSLVRIDRIEKKEPVFIQTCRQVLQMDATDLRLPWRAWKVKLVNEGADDAGGAYDETISEMCNELEREDINPRILIPTPSDSTTFIPNSDPEIPTQYFQFLGILMAAAIRTKKPIDLHLDPMFWKKMTKSLVTVDDLIRLDPAYFNSLLSINEIKSLENCNFEEIYSIDKFTCYNLNVKETEVIYKGSKRKIDHLNLSNFVNSCIYFRLHELDNVIEHVRKGFCSIAPMVLLDIIHWKHLEKMICGSKSINLDSLKEIARYVDADKNDIIFTWFWEILESFTELEKNLFLRFVTGKSRLPSQDSHIPFRLFIYISKQPVNSLPQSQTCFNQIRLPRYNSKLEMEFKLRIAINQCRSIDMDDYMLIRNREN